MVTLLVLILCNSNFSCCSVQCMRHSACMPEVSPTRHPPPPQTHRNELQSYRSIRLQLHPMDRDNGWSLRIDTDRAKTSIRSPITTLCCSILFTQGVILRCLRLPVACLPPASTASPHRMLFLCQLVTRLTDSHWDASIISVHAHHLCDLFA